MHRNAIQRSLMLVAILLLPLVVLVGQQTSTLLIAGPQGQAKVIQVQGKNYVEVDELARITGGSLSFLGNKSILTLPEFAETSSSAQNSAPLSDGLSKPFVNSGIETMREILEWNAALRTAIERDYPLSDEWLGNFRRHIQASLKQAEAVASTDADRKGLSLLISEFNNLGTLTDKYLKISASRDYIAPDSLSRDPLEQRVMTCWHSLESMVSSNQFADDGSCQ